MCCIQVYVCVYVSVVSAMGVGVFVCCVYICVCVYVPCVCVCVSVYIHLPLYSSTILYLIFLKDIFSLNLVLPISRLAGYCTNRIYLLLFLKSFGNRSASIPSFCHTHGLDGGWGSGFRSACLHSKHISTGTTLSHSTEPML